MAVRNVWLTVCADIQKVSEGREVPELVLSRTPIPTGVRLRNVGKV